MNALQIIKKASNPITLLIGLSSVIGGTAAAAAFGSVDLLLVFMCILFTVFAQLASNLAHRWNDERHSYGENIRDGFHEEALEAPVTTILREGINIFSILAAMSGFAIILISGWWSIAVAAIIIIAIVLSFLVQRPSDRSPLYAIATFIIFGPVCVLGTDLVQTFHQALIDNPEVTFSEVFSGWDPIPGYIASIIFGLMAVIVHLVYGSMAYKKNPLGKAVSFRIHPKAACILIIIFGLIACAAGVSTAFFEDIEPWQAFLPIPAIAMAIDIWVAIKVAQDPERPVLVKVAIFNMLFVALSAFVVFALFGYNWHDTSYLPHRLG